MLKYFVCNLPNVGNELMSYCFFAAEHDDQYMLNLAKSVILKCIFIVAEFLTYFDDPVLYIDLSELK